MRISVEPLRIEPPRGLVLLDQTRLPQDEVWLEISSVEALCEAIQMLRVRGAPLLGLAGACGLGIAAATRGVSAEHLMQSARQLRETRPTAVDLGAAVDAGLAAALSVPEPERLELLWKRAIEFKAQRIAEDEALAAFGAELVPTGAAVLTHCNTGALATGGSGTALGVISRAWDEGRLVRCYATETRPLLQGARLTAWELGRLGIPATLLPDTAAASLIASGTVGLVITGADRIAANGDSANKIGTYGLAAVASRHGVPFIIAAPRSTIDLTCPNGAGIPIEFRSASEVGGFGGQRWAPDGVDAYNPAFDVTPGELIAAIVTESGIAPPPFGPSLRALMSGQ
ncbi:MAG: S-methyl-5-thioribose-1-phosphate isomerase [Dehalococcoidia bacterium]|nr:S-methyl-5-thioribose-1-phosphate isomerase [Dehalococcoidia bacterium]MCB9486191.1 S-methyl-5-thioribose-1-phosphate isomerase [Thermoflexaceae bacterium]